MERAVSGREVLGVKEAHVYPPFVGGLECDLEVALGL